MVYLRKITVTMLRAKDRQSSCWLDISWAYKQEENSIGNHDGTFTSKFKGAVLEVCF